MTRIATKSRYLLLFALAICGVVPHSTDAHEVNAQPMRFERLGMDEGLSQSAVNDVVQDATGFMWFATENGLDRFDGYTVVNHRRERGDATSLPNDFITDLSVDANGGLWVATDGGGLAYRAPDEIGFRTFRHRQGGVDSLPDDGIRTVLADPYGRVWIGMMRHGLTRLDVESSEFTHYRHDASDEESLSDDRVSALWLDEAGMLWVGTGRGLNRLDPETGVIERVALGSDEEVAVPSPGRILAIMGDSRGSLWVGTENGGLIRLGRDDGAVQVYRHVADDPRALPSDRVQALLEDSAGRLWIGATGGLSLMDREHGTFTTYGHDPADGDSLSDEFVVSLFEDAGGVLWVGTKTGGVNRWNPRSWTLGHYKQADSGDAGSNNVTSFTHDAEGRLWVGSYGSGISIFGGDGYSRTRLEEYLDAGASLSDDRVMALTTDPDGNVWAGTMHGGLNRIDPETGSVTVFRHDPDDAASLPADGIMSLFVDGAGAVWVGTFGGGVGRFEATTGEFTNYRHDPADPESLSSPNATAIGEDAAGRLWVGTSSGGVNILDESRGTWTRMDHRPEDPASLSSSAVYAIHTDASGAVWIGTRSGLNRYVPPGVEGEGPRFINITQREGLANDVIYGIRSDRSGRLWLSTNHGISRYTPATGEVRSYHASQGLQGEEFNFGAHHTGPDGKLYFGGNNGFNGFDPAELDFRTPPPPIAFTAISKLNRPLETPVRLTYLDAIELDYTEDMVTFEFSALDYSAPEQNRYAYMLEGFDQDWVDAGRMRRATYTNLDGGKYTLRVRAANADGVWNEAGLTLPVQVESPPWATWWAYVLYFVMIASAILMFARAQKLKLEREAEYSRRLESEVRTRTRELAERNSELQVANAKLHEASHTDALTGLRNRRYLFEQISKDIDLVQRHHDGDARSSDPNRNNDIAFIMVDLDHFKPVNDTCGHTAGDRMLLQVRDALLDACRSSDVVIRWGGDEFLVIGREVTSEEVSALAERIRSRIAQTVFALGNGQVARTTCSIGFASYPFLRDRPDLLNWEQVLNIADVAMYEAKEERNAWVGVHGRDWNESGESLVHSLQENLEELSEECHVQVERSLSLANEKLA